MGSGGVNDVIHQFRNVSAVVVPHIDYRYVAHTTSWDLLRVSSMPGRCSRTFVVKCIEPNTGL